MTLKPLLAALACTCAVLSAPAWALGVVDPGATQPTHKPADRRPAAQAATQPPTPGHGYEVAALLIAAMVLAARSIGRRTEP